MQPKRLRLLLLEFSNYLQIKEETRAGLLERIEQVFSSDRTWSQEQKEAHSAKMISHWEECRIPPRFEIAYRGEFPFEREGYEALSTSIGMSVSKIKRKLYAGKGKFEFTSKDDQVPCTVTRLSTAKYSTKQTAPAESEKPRRGRPKKEKS